MLDVNGRKFARTKTEREPDTLGYYAKRGRGILLMDLEKIPFAYIANDGRSQWFVTAGRDEDGRTRYMFGLDSLTEKRLGLDTVKYSGQRDVAREAIESVLSPRIAELTAVFKSEEISEANGATPQRDDNGKVIEDIATCGTCGQSWNDALITGRTPAPSGRCPYEYIHAEIAELKKLRIA